MWTSLKRDSPVVRIFIRPKFMLILSLIILATSLLVIWSKESGMLKAHVTFKECQRDISFPEGYSVQELRYLILRAFYHKLQDKVPPACIKIYEKQDDMDETGEKLLPNKRFFESVEIIVKLAETPQEVAACIYQANTSPTPQHPIAYHRIKTDIHYRFWSPVNGGSHFLRRDDITGDVDCNGTFNDNTYNTVLTSEKYGKYEFYFEFRENAGPSAKTYILDVENGSKVKTTEIKSKSEVTVSMLFMPNYYWSFTLLKNVHYDTLFLGCGDNGEAIMVSMNNTAYPDPRALFITYKFVPNQ